jgi:hypothetical protein
MIDNTAPERLQMLPNRIDESNPEREKNSEDEERLLRVDDWMDDLFDSYHNPQYETPEDDNWCDDLDEAA